MTTLMWKEVNLSEAVPFVFLHFSSFHQPVQGFDYAKQHLGQQGGDEETLPASQDTLMMSLQIRDTPHSLEKALQQDGTANKKSLTTDKHKRYHYIYTYSPSHTVIRYILPSFYPDAEW